MSIADLQETRVQNEVLSTTAEAIHPGIRENYLNAHPGVSIFFGKIGAALSGQIGADGSPSGTAARSQSGESIKVRVKLDANASAGRLTSGYSQISSDTSDTIRGTRANWKLYAGSAVMSGLERRNNRGSAQLADLWTHKHNDSVSSLVDMVGQDIFATTSPANAITSIDTLIDASSTVQGAAVASYSAWVSRGLQAKGTAPGSISFAASSLGGASFTTGGMTNWRRAYLNATEGSIMPNVILTNDDVYLFYESILTPMTMFTTKDAVGQLGFSKLTFRDKPVFHDPYCPSGYTYFINTDTLFGVYADGALFSMTPVMDQAFQDAFSVKILFQGQLVTDGRKYNNKITGQTA